MNRPGSIVSAHAIVLSATPFEEKNIILHFITPEHGIVGAFAKNARQSKKRFGSSIEPMNHIKVQMKAPRESSLGEAPLWFLESADLQNSFAHLRTEFQILDSGFFAVRLVKDFAIPNHADGALFRTLGRYLKEMPVQKDKSAWFKLFFWAWFTKHHGYGHILEGFAETIDQYHPHLNQLFVEEVEKDEPDLLQVYSRFSELPLAPFHLNDQVRIYEQWVQKTGIHWKYFENHLSSSFSLHR